MVQFRTGSTEDVDAVLALFDANVAWLVEQGRSEQWGSEPFSGNPTLVEFVRGLLADGVVTIADVDGEVVGASVVTDHPMPYVPAIGEEERYLKLLIASPAHRGEKIGHRLIERAREYTVAEGVCLLRVDCWSGGDRRLVAYYASEGFTPLEEIEVRPGTSVQVFEWRDPACGERYAHRDGSRI
ncbi:MAG TPA: GNAT family N-acetyltransferase [Thermomicrobiales bacterium]|nr:GNAT family N-acetyltransferase [Thermomicrobiales bacterium]